MDGSMGNWSVWEIKPVMIRNPAGYASPDRVNCVETALCFCYFFGSMSEKIAVAPRIHWGVEIYMVVYIIGAQGLQQLQVKLAAHF